MPWLAECFALVVGASWRAGLLIALLLLTRRLVRGRIPEQVLFLGWIVVAVRLLIPFGFETPWSPFNLAKPVARIASQATAGWTAEAVAGVPATSRTALKPSPAVSWTTVAAGVWAGGVGVLLVLRLGAPVVLRRRVRLGRVPADDRVVRVARDCAAELGLRGTVGVDVTRAVNVPSLFGVLRPRVLLPVGFADQLSDEELRLVLLHELGHHHRRDLLVQTLLQLGRILHWFNPLVWWGVRQARLDCEFACDEYVLRRQSADQAAVYGATLLKMMTRTRGRVEMPLVLGLAESKRLLQQRIWRIATYQRSSRTCAVLGVGLVALVIVLGATRETWAENAVKAVMAAMLDSTPAGWRRIPYGSEEFFQVGLDPAQPFRDRAATAFIKVLMPDAEMDWRQGFGQACHADRYRGQRVRFSAWIRTADVTDGAVLWMSADGKRRHWLQMDGMRDRPVIGTTDWTAYSVVIDVPPEAVTLNYGFAIVGGTGQAWFSHPRIEVVGRDVPSTNTVRTYPALCTNKYCTSSICAPSALRHTLVNPTFLATTAP